MQIQPASLADLPVYVSLAQVAQAWLIARGLGQYVPAAHQEYADAIRSRVANGTLFVVRDTDAILGFFSLDSAPSPWWPVDGEPALYLAGMVVARAARGQGVGAAVIARSVVEAVRRGVAALRLDCHAENPWLCRYYESHGFVRRGQIEQHPGYVGYLYERACEMP